MQEIQYLLCKTINSVHLEERTINMSNLKAFLEKPAIQSILLIIETMVLVSLGSIPASFLLPLQQSISNEVIKFSIDYAMNFGLWVVFFIYWAVKKKYRPLFQALGPKAKGNNIKTAILLGIPLGFGMNLLLAVFSILHGDFSLGFSELNIGYILLFVIVVFIQSGSEEIICRVHLYQNLRRLFPDNKIVAICGNALIFAVFHLFNPGISLFAILNLIACGVLYSLLVYYFDSLWAAIVAHTGWNFCQNIFLGLPNSGRVSEYSVFRIEDLTSNSSFFYDPVFGIEGSLITLILQILACLLLWRTGEKRNRKPLDIWE